MKVPFGKDGSGVTLQTRRGAVKRENVDQYQQVYCWEYAEDTTNGFVYVELRDNFRLRTEYLYVGDKWRMYEDSSDRLVMEYYDGGNWNSVAYFQGA